MLVISICADIIRARRLGGIETPELLSIAIHAPTAAHQPYDGVSLHLPSAGLENAGHARRLAAELIAEAEFIEQAIDEKQTAAVQALIADAAEAVEAIDPDDLERAAASMRVVD